MATYVVMDDVTGRIEWTGVDVERAKVKALEMTARHEHRHSVFSRIGTALQSQWVNEGQTFPSTGVFEDYSNYKG